jgi:hypothetical protein
VREREVRRRHAVAHDLLWSDDMKKNTRRPAPRDSRHAPTVLDGRLAAVTGGSCGGWQDASDYEGEGLVLKVERWARGEF